MENMGKIDIVLDEYMKKNNISRNKLTRLAGLQYNQTLKYCRNEMQKVDLNILSKICTVLDCEITDILKLTKGSTQ